MLCYPVDNVDKSVQNHKNLVKWAVDMWIKIVDNLCGQTGPNVRLDFFGDFFVHFVQCVCLNPRGGGEESECAGPLCFGWMRSRFRSCAAQGYISFSALRCKTAQQVPAVRKGPHP